MNPNLGLNPAAAAALLRQNHSIKALPQTHAHNHAEQSSTAAAALNACGSCTTGFAGFVLMVLPRRRQLPPVRER
jgi:hypothetical protein